jgi:hypothetical protein
MVTRTEAASKSCTCWCLEIKSLEVIAHAGSCSHLIIFQQLSTDCNFVTRGVKGRGTKKGI